MAGDSESDGRPRRGRSQDEWGTLGDVHKGHLAVSARSVLREASPVRQRLQVLAHSRALLVTGIVVALAVPALTLPRLPEVNLWPALIGLLPWVVGKYLLCALRWRALTAAGFTRRWHLRAYAESELLGLLTPGHVGADAWRIHRLTHAGVPRGDSLTSVASDRVVGAIGLAAFVVLAGAALPARALAVALVVAAGLATGLYALNRVRPGLLPAITLPSRTALAYGLLLSAAYQLSIAALLVGSVTATGHSVSPLVLLGAFGATQVAGIVPGPQGASPRDGALVVALVALGMPWMAATAAVTLKAALAWLPALVLGGVSLLLTRRARRAAALAV